MSIVKIGDAKTRAAEPEGAEVEASDLKVRILKDLIQALDDVILCGPLRLLLRLLRQARAPRRDAHVDAALLLQEGIRVRHDLPWELPSSICTEHKVIGRSEAWHACT